MAFRELTSSQSTSTCGTRVALVSALEEQARRNSRVRVRICNEIFAIVIPVEGLGWLMIGHERKEGNGKWAPFETFNLFELEAGAPAQNA